MTLLIISLFITPICIQGDYQVTIGQTFTYKVNKSYWRVKVGGNSGSASKFYFFPSSRPLDKSITIEVTDVIPDDSVDYNITVESTTIPTSCDDFSNALELTMNMFYFNILGIVFNNPWNQMLVDDGPNLNNIYFLNTNEDTLDLFRSYSNSTYLASHYTVPAYESTRIEGNFDETGTIAIFDWIVEGAINTPISVDPFFIEGYYLYKFAFNKNTGVEQGYRIELDFEGTNGGENFEIFMEQEVTLEGYNLPDFYFSKPIGLSGFEWYIVIGGLSILAIPIIIYKKRKQK